MTAELKSRGMMHRKELVSKPVRGRVGQSASRIRVKNLGVFCCTARLRGMVSVYRFLAYALKSTYQYISIISYAMLQQGTIDMFPISWSYAPTVTFFRERCDLQPQPASLVQFMSVPATSQVLPAGGQGKAKETTAVMHEQ